MTRRAPCGLPTVWTMANISPTPQWCDQCGARLTGAPRFCQSCGAEVGPAASIPPPDSHPATPGTTENFAEPALPAREPKRFFKPLLALSLAGVLVLATAGFFVVRALTGGSGGAATATDAMKQLVQGVQKKDLAAMIATLEPAETRGLLGLTDDIRKKSEDGGITKVGNEFDGVEVALEGIEYQEQSLSERLSRVSITAGKGTFSLEKSKLPATLKDLLKQEKVSTSLTPQEVQDKTHQQVSLIVEKDDSGWFISPFYSFLDHITSTEAARERGLTPTWSSTLATSRTSQDPRQLVQDFLSALGNGGIDAALPYLEPHEQTVIRDSEPLWDEVYQKGRSEGYIPTGTVTINASEVTDGADGSKQVSISSLSGRGSNRYGSATFALNGPTATWSSTESSSHGRANWIELLTGSRLRDNSRLIDQLNSINTPLVVATVPTEGGYAISLVGTLTSSAGKAVTTVPTQLLQSLLGLQYTMKPLASLAPNQQVSAPVDDVGQSLIQLKIENAGNYRISATDDSARIAAVFKSVGQQVYGEQQCLDDSAGYCTNYSDDYSYQLKPGTYMIVATPAESSDSSVAVRVEQAS